MSFSDQLNKFITEGLDASKDLLKKAGEKTKDLGEMGMLRVEIFQLRGQAEKACAKLGADCFARLRERGEVSLNRDDQGVKDLLDKIEGFEKKIDEKEARFKAIGGKDEDLKP
ncbi:MAG: hypothetical protein NT080_05685 [Spirochaetes bacterium]|nr:hypothetical protein [Spirochaetota bacterium]